MQLGDTSESRQQVGSRGSNIIVALTTVVIIVVTTAAATIVIIVIDSNIIVVAVSIVAVVWTLADYPASTSEFNRLKSTSASFGRFNSGFIINRRCYISLFQIKERIKK